MPSMPLAGLRGACAPPGLLLVLALAWHAEAHPGTAHAGAELMTPARTPLRTQGRYIVDNRGQRIKWACVNWYGAYSTTHVVGGLEIRPLQEIVDRILDLGFNCVRAMYSTEGYANNPLVKDEDLAANPDLKGKRFLELFDLSVKAMTDAGLMVIINNHISKSGWCCHYSQDEGLWYVPEYPEEVWIESLVFFANRYKNNSLVVGYDLRNEVHDYEGTHVSWGDGNSKTDWALAATKSGNAVLEADPDAVIIVMAMCFGMDLRRMKDAPIQLSHPNRVIYQAHNYLEYQVFDNIAKQIAPWSRIRDVLLVLVVISLLLILFLRSVWASAGFPTTRKTVVVVSLAFWIGIFMLIGILVSHFSVQFGNQFCSVSTDTDIVPWLHGTSAAFAVCMATVLIGLVVIWCFPKDRSPKGARTAGRAPPRQQVEIEAREGPPPTIPEHEAPEDDDRPSIPPSSQPQSSLASYVPSPSSLAASSFGQPPVPAIPTERQPTEAMEDPEADAAEGVPSFAMADPDVSRVGSEVTRGRSSARSWNLMSRISQEVTGQNSAHTHATRVSHVTRVSTFRRWNPLNSLAVAVGGRGSAVAHDTSRRSMRGRSSARSGMTVGTADSGASAISRSPRGRISFAVGHNRSSARSWGLMSSYPVQVGTNGSDGTYITEYSGGTRSRAAPTATQSFDVLRGRSSARSWNPMSSTAANVGGLPSSATPESSSGIIGGMPAPRSSSAASSGVKRLVRLARKRDRRAFGLRAKNKATELLDPTPEQQWDFSMFCMLQLVVLLICLVVLFLFIYVWAHILPTYWWMERHLDGLWGFALEEGHSWTAPVWMGEFGGNVRGQYWMNFMRYMAVRDVDFAYWAINGIKWSEGFIDGGSGEFTKWLDGPRWANESFGILSHDYNSIRHTWKMMDLQSIMPSPASWRPDGFPCNYDTDPSCGR